MKLFLFESHVLQVLCKSALSDRAGVTDPSARPAVLINTRHIIQQGPYLTPVPQFDRKLRSTFCVDPSSHPHALPAAGMLRASASGVRPFTAATLSGVQRLAAGSSAPRAPQPTRGRAALSVVAQAGDAAAGERGWGMRVRLGPLCMWRGSDGALNWG